ncbi:putative bifunctional diguanylate cyclase/phosphodiesterase [Roseomonas sp. GCM10028921]
MFLTRQLRMLWAAALVLLITSSAVPTVYCLQILSGLDESIQRTAEAETQAKQARQVVDVSGRNIASYAAIALDLTTEERGKVLQDADQNLQLLRQLFPALGPIARNVLTSEEYADLQDTVSSLTHNWSEIREQAETGMAEAEKTFHFLRVFDGTLLIRAALAKIEEAAVQAAQGQKLRTLEGLRTTGQAFAIVIICGGTLGLLASLCVYQFSRMTRAANEALVDANASLRQRDAHLAQQNARFDAALGNMCQGLGLFDDENRLLVSNKRFGELLGLPDNAVSAGMSFEQIMSLAVARGSIAADSSASFQSNCAALVVSGRHASTLWEMADGRGLAINTQSVDGQGWLITSEDITQRRAAEAKIHYMAHHDALTGLPNRVHLQEELSDALKRVGRGEQLAVLCLDLDRFKAVNDTLGHPIGDALLRAVAARIRECTREVDTPARLGGDEFAMVQVGAGQPEQAIALAQRLIASLSAPYEIQGHHVIIGTSIGITIAPQDGRDASELLKCADLALYRAKKEGRGTYRFFEPDMDAKMQMRRKLELDLRGAAVRGEFELYYQPLVHLQSNEVSGFEALLRWRHPVQGLISPAEFVPLAEEIGLIAQIGAWVLRTACSEAAGWPADKRVAVNLSPVQFKHAGLVQDVKDALQISRLAPSRLELEITETSMLEDTEATLKALNELRSLGVRIAIDDFGTGYSSLSYLRRFPFDKIKVDQSLVRDIAEKTDAALIVRAVMGLGHSLGMATTIEGVETFEQLEKLRHEGCSEVQGYYFGRPRPASDVHAFISAIAQRSEDAA